MRSVFIVALLAACGCADDSVQAYKHYIDIIYEKIDTNKDGKLSCDEFTTLIEKVGMVCSGSLQPPQCVDNVAARCAAADPNGDGATEQELTDYIKSLVEGNREGDRELGRVFLEKLTNVNTNIKAITDGIGKVDAAIETASVVVEVTVPTSLNMDELFAGERAALKKAFAALMGVPPENLYLTIMPGSAIIRARAYYADEATAAEGKEKAEASLATPDKAQQALAVPVSAAATVSQQFPYGFHPIDYTLPAVMGGVTLVLVLLAIAIASFAAKRRLAYKGEASKFPGCCTTGCCSAYAVKGWSFNVGVGSFAFAIIGAVLLYLSLNSAADAMEGLVLDLYALRDLGGDAASFLSMIEPYLDFWQPFVPYVSMLDLGAILPGALTCVWLVLASLCACRNSKSLCCAKLFAFLSNVFLVVCFVFYAIFASLSNAVKVPLIQRQLKVVFTLCFATLPNARQQLTDALNAVRSASSTPGVSAAQYANLTTTLHYAQNLTNVLSSTCGHADVIFDESVPRVFVPGCVCLLAVVFAFYTVNGLCCAAKCCSTPEVTKNNDNLALSTDVKYEIEADTKQNAAV